MTTYLTHTIFNDIKRNRKKTGDFEKKKVKKYICLNFTGIRRYWGREDIF